MNLIYQTFKNIAKRHLSKVAIIDDLNQYDYQALLTEIDAITAFLAFTFEHPPRAALLSDNAKDLFCITMAIARLGGTCIPTNPSLTLEQLQSSWSVTDTNIIIHDNKYFQKLKSSTHEAQLLDINNIDKSSLNNNIYDDKSIIDDVPNDFLITLSSGSTGKPKPIVLSQTVKIKRAIQTTELYNITDKDVILCASPFYHSLGQRLFFVPLLHGATLVYMKKFSPQIWLKAVSTYQVSFVICVSTHLYALNESIIKKSDTLKSLKTIVSSSAPIDSDFKAKLFESVGCEFYEIYGATEIATATNLSPTEGIKHYQTVGRPCKDVDIKILNEKMHEVDANVNGEIAVKSKLAFNAYYKLPKLTNDSYHDGYFLTGDIGFINQEGYLTYVSRQKDIIISGGINIYPRDIEEVILEHPQINEVAVIGVLDKLLGEVIIAICICDNKTSVERDLYRLVNSKLAPYQRPLKYFFQDHLPLTSSGKISKELLREKYNNLNEDWSAALRTILFR